MRKWLIGGGIAGVLVLALLIGGVRAFVSAKASTPSTPAQEATITPEEAKAAVLAEYPGATAGDVELKENGTLVYEVELDSGLEVLVDASDGTIVGTDQEEAGEVADDADNVQDEVEDQSEVEDESEIEDADEPGDVDVGGDVEDADGSVGD